jgi:hypothetical protein
VVRMLLLDETPIEELTSTAAIGGSSARFTEANSGRRSPGGGPFCGAGSAVAQHVFHTCASSKPHPTLSCYYGALDEAAETRGRAWLGDGSERSDVGFVSTWT